MNKPLKEKERESREKNSIIDRVNGQDRERKSESYTHTQTHLIKKKQRTFGLNIRNKSKYSKRDHFYSEFEKKDLCIRSSLENRNTKKETST